MTRSKHEKRFAALERRIEEMNRKLDEHDFFEEPAPAAAPAARELIVPQGRVTVDDENRVRLLNNNGARIGYWSAVGLSINLPGMVFHTNQWPDGRVDHRPELCKSQPEPETEPAPEPAPPLSKTAQVGDVVNTISCQYIELVRVRIPNAVVYRHVGLTQAGMPHRFTDTALNACALISSADPWRKLWPGVEIRHKLSSATTEVETVGFDRIEVNGVEIDGKTRYGMDSYEFRKDWEIVEEQRDE